MKTAVLFFACVLLLGQTIFSQPDETAKPPIPGIEITTTRCKSGCTSGKFNFTLILFNKSAYKIRIDKNELKYKLRISYKPGAAKVVAAKKGKKTPAPAQPFKTIAFMQAGASSEDWADLEPGDFTGFRKEVDLGQFDKGLCNSSAITIYGVIQIIEGVSHQEMEINQKITESCAI